MELRPTSGADREELERLRESGVLVGGVALERVGPVPDRVLVRPVIGDELAEWMPHLERELAVVKGVVGVCGTDMAEAAGLAADAAAWLGDRGKAVVLVDAVVENPVLGKALYEDRDEGLVDAVLFGVSREAVVRRTLAPGVSVITVGSHPLSVDSVFEAEEFSKILRGLADDALVLVLVPAAHVPTAVHALETVVCVAGSGADVASLASLTDALRTVGVVVSERVEAADATVEESGEPVVRPALVLPTREDSARQTDDEEPAAESTPEIPKLGGAEEETGAAVVTGPERSPVLIGASSRRGRRRRGSDRVAITVAVLVIAAIATLFWWFVDGERRFGPQPGGSVRTEHERVAEGRDVDPPEGGASPVVETAEVAAVELSSDGEVARTAEVLESGADGADDSSSRPELEGLERDIVISGPGGPYQIMVSSHRHEAAANVEARQLIGRGAAADVMATEVEGRGIWFRVVVSGGYPTLSAAREILDTVKFLGYEGAWIERVADNE